MKKFVVFISCLVLLIVSEYFLVSELFFSRRLPVLLISLLCSLVFIYGAYRFFKKYFIAAKHS